MVAYLKWTCIFRNEKTGKVIVASIGDEVIGECEFESEDDTWTILHTGVDEAYGGRGIAKKLVISVAEAAIKYNKKIVPLCTYAKKVLENNDEYKKIIG